MKIKILASLLLIVVLFASCVSSQPDVVNCLSGKTYGFWGGLWHGIIAPISWLISLFNDNVAVYAIKNNGGWYDFGFLLGIGAFARGTYSLKK